MLLVRDTSIPRTGDRFCLSAKAVRPKQVAKQRKREVTLFAGQKPYPTWRAASPPPDEPCPDTFATDPVAAESKRVIGRAVGSLAVLIVSVVGLGVATLTSVVLLATLIPRPASPPQKTAATSPAPEAALPPLTAATSKSSGQMISAEERLAKLEPPPIQIGVSPEGSPEAAPPSDSTTLVRPQPSPREATPPLVLAPLPPSRPPELAPSASSTTSDDQTTAVYDISAHTVHLPDGMRLEAHSGLGDRIDDPRFVDERDHGATPPGVYQLTLRESLFHGVQALRLTPIGGGFTFNRVGLLAHPYMLGPNGDSNGCVSFKNYDIFLRAFQSGGVKRLAVVAQWAGRPRQFGVLANLGQTPRW